MKFITFEPLLVTFRGSDARTEFAPQLFVRLKSGLDEASIQRDRDCVSTVIRSEFRENALHVPLDRSFGNRELFRDEFV